MVNDTASALDPFRARVISDVRSLLDDLDLTHAELVQQHLASVESGETRVFDAAALHLLALEAMSGNASKGLPVASSMALIALSTNVMQALASSALQPAGVLEESWGMPRTLNAGDAFYVLAQQSLMRLLDAGTSPEDVMKASSILRSASFGLCEDLLAPGRAASSRALVASVALAALLAEASHEQVDGLISREWLPDAEALQSLGRDASAVMRLAEVIESLAKERWK